MCPCVHCFPLLKYVHLLHPGYSFCSCLGDVVKKLSSLVIGDDPFHLIVRRSHVLEDALKMLKRSSFHPMKKTVASFDVMVQWQWDLCS